MPPTKMTAEHKKALAEGREQSRAVKAYLEAVARPKRRGRQRSREDLVKALQQTEKELAEDNHNPLQRLLMLQRRNDLAQAIEMVSGPSDLKELERLEADFVKAALPYSEAKGIEYATWRELGVPSAVLKKAGF